MSTRIHAVHDKAPYEHWTAWIDGNSRLAFGGQSPGKAVEHLLEFAGMDPATLHADLSQCSGTKFVFIHDGKTCQECGGRGKYIGLYKVAECCNCGGSGLV
jgi:hypothetical protein